MKVFTHPLMLATAALVALPLTSCQSEPQTPLAVTVAMQDCIVQLTKIIDTVKDLDSADAAAAEVTTLVNRYKSLAEKQKTLPAPSAEEKAELAKLKPELELAGINFFGKFMKLVAHQCYGSKKLEEAFMPMMKM